MSGESNIINEIADSFDGFLNKETSSHALRIRYLKREIEKTLIANHDCGSEQLEFLLQRL